MRYEIVKIDYEIPEGGVGDLGELARERAEADKIFEALWDEELASDPRANGGIGNPSAFQETHQPPLLNDFSMRTPTGLPMHESDPMQDIIDGRR